MKIYIKFLALSIFVYFFHTNIYAQQLRSTKVINGCVTEYTMGNATEDLYVIVVFTCSSPWTSSVQLTELSAVLVVAGGGGGGKRSDSAGEVRGAGGGGAGGVTYIDNVNNLILNGFANLEIEVGLGGPGSLNPTLRGSSGEDSKIITDQFNHLISKGGGGGGSAGSGVSGDDQRRGGVGGSGGGGVSKDIPGGDFFPLNVTNSGIGNRGCNGVGTRNEDPTGGGGGGGVNSAGETPGATKGGVGGGGRSYPFLTLNLPIGIPKGFAAGGGGVGGNPGGILFAGEGGEVNGLGIIGGSGVNGNNGNPGVPLTGSGGGAGGATVINTFRGGNGAQGIVIIRYDFARILPVMWRNTGVNFYNNGRKNKILWSTSKEWENSHFDIERSLDGTKTFTKVGEVAGMGWTDEVTEYVYEDDKLPLSGGNIFYRLKQVDFNGRFDYSDVVAVRVPNVHFTTGVWRAYPNPSQGADFRLELVDLSRYQDEPVTLRVLSSTMSSNEMIFKNLQELNSAASAIMANAPNGLWIIELQWGNKVERIKVVKR